LKCAATGEKIVFIKCPICHKLVCENCVVSRSGRAFCGQYCADDFFFGDEEE
jgi:hypothetical protein